MDDIALKKYLHRVNFSSTPLPELESLIALHKHHILTVPFEDLDIHHNRDIKIDFQSIYQKVVINNRGGFCYELNHLFYRLLKRIGFDCKMISARVYADENTIGPDYDHLAILVKLKKTWLVDVGFGNLSIEPIEFNLAKKSIDRDKTFKFSKVDESNYLLSESIDGFVFEKKYQLNINERQIDAFKAQCHFKQYSPDSHFVKKKICTIATTDGRATILNNEFIVTKYGNKITTPIQSNAQYELLLKEVFNIIL